MADVFDLLSLEEFPAPFCPRKYAEPTPEELGLPFDPDELRRLEYACAAPRAAWEAYYAATGGLHEEAKARASAKARKRQLGARR
jgi:hypothetical protein